MNENAKRLQPLYQELAAKINEQDFLTDKSGVKIVETISPRVVLDPMDLYVDFETKKSPRKYVDKETDWYLSHELKINKVSDVEIWNRVCDSNREINSNYGNLVHSRSNFSQFSNVVETLKNHKESRQAIIIYTRPSIHYEWNSHGASDFICTNYQQFFIRNNKLHCVTSQRSCDCYFGVMSDIPWFHQVIQKALAELTQTYLNLELGDHIWIPNSFHAYERHFDKILSIASETN